MTKRVPLRLLAAGLLGCGPAPGRGARRRGRVRRLSSGRGRAACDLPAGRPLDRSGLLVPRAPDAAQRRPRLCAGRRLEALLQLRAPAAGGVPARRARRRGTPAARPTQGLTLTRADDAQSGDYYVLEPTERLRPARPRRRRARSRSTSSCGRSSRRTRRPAGTSPSTAAPLVGCPPGRCSIASDPRQTTVFEGDKRPVETAGHPLRPEHRAADGARAGRPDPAAAARARSAGAAPSGSIARRTAISHALALRAEAAYLESALADVLGGDFARESRGGGGSAESTRSSPSIRRRRRRGLHAPHLRRPGSASSARTAPGCCTASRRCGS